MSRRKPTLVPGRHSTLFRYYAELNDFLRPDQANHEIVYPFYGHPPVKEAIEHQGVPHTEVEIILANGKSVDFLYRLQDGDRISVYPVFESLDIAPLLRLRETPLRQTRFVADVHLGRLARRLRLLGFDVVYDIGLDDTSITALSATEHRIVLTRDRRLLHRKAISHGYWLRSNDPEEQLMAVLRRFQLEQGLRPFTRCMECNVLIEPVAKEVLDDHLEPETERHYQDFFRCTGCGRIYWQGSHYQRMLAEVQQIREQLENCSRV